MKLLSGEELAGYIKERQAREVRALRQAWHVQPKLVFVAPTGVQDDLSAQAQAYGADILIDVDIHQTEPEAVPATIQALNDDAGVHGVAAQPGFDLQEISIVPEKDVDALGKGAVFEPAVLTAVMWMLAGYNIDPQSKKVVFIDRNAPADRLLGQILKDTGVEIVPAGPDSDASTAAPEADIAIDDLDPLIVCALFENVIRSARRTAESQP